MTTVAQLTIEMAANVARLQKDMQKVTTTVDGAMGKVKKSADVAVKALGAIGVALSAGALAGMVRDFARLGSELSKFSTLSGVGVEQFQKISAGAKRFGIEQEKLADILKDTQDKIGDFLQTGGGGMADFFERIAPRVGVTAQNFRDLNGADALQLYVTSLQKANLSQSEMVFFMEAIASDSAALIPLFADGGAALNEYAEQARRLGLILSEETIAQAQEFDRTLTTLGEGLTGVGRMVAAELLPTLNNLAGSMLESMTEGERLKGLSVALAMVMKGLASAVIVVVDIFRMAARGIKGFADAIVAISEGRFGDAGDALKSAFVDNLDIARQSIESIKDVFGNTGAEAIKTINNLNKATGAFIPNQKELDKATKEAAAAAKQQEAAFKLAQKAIEDARKESEALVSAENKATQQIQDQVQAIREQIDLLGKTESQIQATRRANLEFSLSVVEMRKAMAMMSGGNRELIAEYDAQIQAIRDLIAVQGELAGKQASQDRIEAQKEANKEIVDNFLDLFKGVSTQSGKQFADDLKRSLQIQFQSFVLRVGVEAALSSSVGSAISGFGTQGGGLGGIFQAAGSFANMSAASNTFANAAVFASSKLSQFAGLSSAATGTFTSAAMALGKAVPYIGAAVAVGSLLGIGRNKKIPAELLGNAIFGFSGTGQETGAVGNAGGQASDIVRSGAQSIADAYVQTVQSLGGRAVDAFEVAFAANTGRQGRNPNFGLDVRAGGRALFVQGETAANEANQGLASLRAVFALLTESTLAENVRQVVTGLDFANASFEQLSATLSDAQLLAAVNNLSEVGGVMGTLSGASLQTVQSLLALTGGIEGLSQGQAAFYDAFTSEEQKRIDLTKAVTDAFAEFNMAVPQSRDELRRLRDGLNLQDETSAQLFATILNLTPALDQLLPAFEQLTDQATDFAQAVRDAESALQAAIDAERSQLQATINAAQEAENELRRIYNEQASELQGVINRFTQFNRQIRDLRTSLAERVTFGQGTVGFALTRFQDVANRALAGDESAFGEIAGATTGYLDSFQDYAGDFVEYAREFARVQGVLAGVEDSTALTADTATQQLITLREQVGRLIQLNNTNVSIEQAMRAVEVAQMDANAAQSRIEQLNNIQNDLLGNINESVLSVEAAIQLLNQARSNAGGGGGAGGGNANSLGAVVDTTDPNQAFVAQLYEQIGGRQVDPAGLDFYSNQLASGTKTPQDVINDLVYAKQQLGAAFADGGRYMGGMALVGEEGPELINFRNPGMVYTAAQTQSMMSGNNDAMAAKLDALQNEMRMLRMSNESVAMNSHKQVRILERWDDGDAIATREVVE